MGDEKQDCSTVVSRRRAIENAIRHNDRVLVSWLAKKFGDVETARDIAQSAYLRLWRYAENEPVENAQALLFRTAANLAANEFRSRRRMRLVSAPADHEGESLLDQVASDAPSPESETEARQTLTISMAVIKALPENARRAFVLSRFEGKNYREIAATLKVSESSVEKYVIAALKALRLAVKDREPPGRILPFQRRNRQ